MEKSTILKLRQLESNDVTTNGSYKVTLKEGITMVEGDSMKIHTAILDTTTESVITLAKDTPITMTTIKYITNIQNGALRDTATPPNNVAFQPLYVANPASTPMPDLKKYYSSHGVPTGTDVYHLAGINTRPKNAARTNFGGIHLKFSYEDPVTGLPVTDQSAYFPPQKVVKHLRKPFEFVISKFVKNQVFIITNSEQEFKDANMDVPNVQDNVWANGGAPVASGILLTKPHEETLSFTIKEGTYTPPELGQIISDNMSLFNSSGTTGTRYVDGVYPFNNPFLSSQAREQYLVSQIAPVGTHVSLYMPEVIPEFYPTVPNIMQMGSAGAINPVITDIADDKLIGANQTSLNFDNNLKKLNFDILHTPYFSDPGNGQFVPAVFYPLDERLPATTPPTLAAQEPMQQYSGIAFSNLTPIDFWASLGFEDVLAKISQPNPAEIITLDDATEVFTTHIEATVGKQLTGVFLGNDILVDKIANFSTPSVAPAITSLTAPIIADRTFDQVKNDEGYYLLDVGVKFPQKMVGGQNNSKDGLQTGSNRVQGIMGKYFTSGNFLQDTGAAAVTYTHVGEPQMINELDVRVLHADGTPPLPNELGPKNSIFLEIIRPIVAAAAEAEKPK